MDTDEWLRKPMSSSDMFDNYVEQILNMADWSKLANNQLFRDKALRYAMDSLGDRELIQDVHILETEEAYNSLTVSEKEKVEQELRSEPYSYLEDRDIFSLEDVYKLLIVYGNEIKKDQI